MEGCKWASLLLKLTCEGEVGEDQQAAAAEADGTPSCGQPRQQEETEGQFTRVQRRCSLQHAFHGFSEAMCTRRFLLTPQGREALEFQVLEEKPKNGELARLRALTVTRPQG